LVLFHFTLLIISVGSIRVRGKGLTSSSWDFLGNFLSAKLLPGYLFL